MGTNKDVLYEAIDTENEAKAAESRRDFNLAAKLYQQAAGLYSDADLTSDAARCRSIANLVDDSV